MPAVPPMVQRPPAPSRPTPRANWTFRQSEAECTATAAGDGVSVLVTVSRDAPIRLTISLPSPPRGALSVSLRFAGTAGNWQLAARSTPARQVMAELGTDDMALSRVLALLSGGMLEVGSRGVAIAPADSQGQQWFDCARRQIF